MSRFWSCEGLGTPMISWGIWEFQVRSLQCFRPGWWSSYLTPTTNHWYFHWQKPATSVLRTPRESYDGQTSCKIKCTWAFFFALKIWLTWYQVVDHVCHLQSNMVKGKCSINDSLNTKASPFFETPIPSLYWLMGTKSTSSIKHAHQSLSQYLPSIDLPRTGYSKTISTRYDATSSSHITLDHLELP